MRGIHKAAVAALAGLGMTAGAEAANIVVTNNISTATTWTANNTYDLANQIFVLPGATLTIEAGTVVASTPTINGAGAIAVTRGAQIFVCGTKDDPVIMTSTADVATWDPDGSHPTGGDPKTGVWRESALEWGNLTIMGNGYISEDPTIVPGNVETVDADNRAFMEGLAAPPIPNGAEAVKYGGGDDDDDSGKIEYLSIRYGGRVVGFANELNGLSLGGVGRETEIHHVEIMNNVDDGIEIWGGAVNLKYISVWNIGDDSIDVDQGWRGCGQFILIVQGYSLDDDQGSGVGDNCFETDGAENSDQQPVTVATFYNCTAIGEPNSGDHGTAWRDNARVAYRNCIFMDLGSELVRFDNLDGDGALGYGHNGTMSWADSWNATLATVPPHVNDPVSLPYPTFYYEAEPMLGLVPKRLCQIVDSVFFRNLAGSAYTEATARGVFGAANMNVLTPGANPANAPITSLVREPLTTKGGLSVQRVISLDPTPKNAALLSADQAPDDKFWHCAPYRGAFAQGEYWLAGWTASYAYGFTPQDYPWCEVSHDPAFEGIVYDDGVGNVPQPGEFGSPRLLGQGPLTGGSLNQLTLCCARPSAVMALWGGLGNAPAPFKGGVLKPLTAAPLPPLPIEVILVTNAQGKFILPFVMPAGFAGFDFTFQCGIQDPMTFGGISLSTAQVASFQ